MGEKRWESVEWRKLSSALSSYLCSLRYAPTPLMFATCWQLAPGTDQLPLVGPCWIGP
eukprot:COSAG06_NODE_1761_length_8450_cov_7621.426536_10_plen_58_part_00